MTTIDGRAGLLLDHRAIDWARVSRVRFSLHERLSYTYPSPITRLRHRVMVVPAAGHGDQRLVSSAIEVSGAEVVSRDLEDEFGNARFEIRADRVDRSLAFDVWAVAERTSAQGRTRLPAAALVDDRLLAPTPLTWPDRAMRDVAVRLAGGRAAEELDPADALVVARRINAWVHKVMRYRPGVTNVDTTATRALGLAQGVCQDYAHVMIALCRLAGVPARYVSGHLLGEGGSHAWVEVVVAADEGAVAIPFDPTHGRETGPEYLTVAVGRDYSDVAPTFGTFEGEGQGRLTTVKRLGVTEVDLSDT